MSSVTRVAQLAALVGDTSRASMLTIMMDGRSHTAGELAAAADISAATASGHLGKLLDHNLVSVIPQGRRRYFRLFSAEVAQMLESIVVVSAAPAPRLPLVPRVPAELREARTCYDHVAGRLGVAMAEAFLSPYGPYTSVGDVGFTARGREVLTELEIDVNEIRGTSRRPLCRPCLDWSERRPHLAGLAGTALFHRMLQLHWIKQIRHSREIRITTVGARELFRHFGYKRL